MMGDVAKQARLAERFSESRLVNLRACIDGQCEVRRRECDAPASEPRETTMVCASGCGRTLHARSCAHVSSGHALVGRFVCHHCRLREMGAEGQPLPEVLNSVAKTVLLELTTGRQATAEGYERFARLA